MGSDTPPDMRFVCWVCGLEEDEPPWGEDGKTPLFDMCVCCGVEHGYEDALPIGIRRYREQWLAKGAPWWHPRFRPEGWSLEEQLENVPPQFR